MLITTYNTMEDSSSSGLLLVQVLQRFALNQNFSKTYNTYCVQLLLSDTSLYRDSYTELLRYQNGSALTEFSPDPTLKKLAMPTDTTFKNAFLTSSYEVSQS